MNLKGSWRRLSGNSMSAMLAAIEVYNKPRMAYRDEVFVILLVNAWELLLKAIVSKSGRRIYYPKKRGEPYRSLSWQDAFWRAANSGMWPKAIPAAAVHDNIEMLSNYRDSAIHFYNDREFGSLVYSLAQTSVINFKDVASQVFGRDMADEVNWRIMPLGVETPVDPVQFMKSARSGKTNRAVQDFLAYLQEKTQALDAAGVPTDRLCTVFEVSLNSVKKIDKADIVVGIDSGDLAEGVVVQRRIDPNLSHPYRRKELLPKLRRPLTTHQFDAVVRVRGLLEDPKYCWRDTTTNLVKWSPETMKYLDGLTNRDIAEACAAYSELRRRKPRRLLPRQISAVNTNVGAR